MTLNLRVVGYIIVYLTKMCMQQSCQHAHVHTSSHNHTELKIIKMNIFPVSRLLDEAVKRNHLASNIL